MPTKMTKYEEKNNQIDKNTWQGEHLENRKRGEKDTNKEKYRMTANFLLGIKKAEVNEKTLLTW